MKLTILGGAGVRTPVFVEGILKLSSDLGIEEVHLLDSDPDKLRLIGFIIREIVGSAGDPFRLRLSSDAREAIEDADFVVSALRVGGLQGRAIDEAVALRHGVIGQETTGPGGICMALRTIPVMLEYARLIAELAPKAWLINFTNPSGMITEAILSHGGMKRVVGVCDGPSSMVRRISSALGVDESRAYFDYFGLNHLGWLRGVYVDGEDVLGPVLARLDEPAIRERMRGVHEVTIFGEEFVKELGAVPNEYLYYYYYSREALEHIRHAKETRGQFLLRTTGGLMERLKAAAEKGDAALALREYTQYMDTRHKMYMRTETGTGPAEGRPAESHPAEDGPASERASGRDAVTRDATAGGAPARDGTAIHRTSREAEATAKHATPREATATVAGTTPDARVAPGLDDNGDDSGYDRIALGVMNAVVLNSNQVMILNTRNEGSISGLDDEVVVEVPCVVGSDGVRPIAVGRIPGECLGLMQMIKACERLAIEAAVTGSYHAAWKALALHPLVPSAAVAREILDGYLRSHGRSLSHIRP